MLLCDPIISLSLLWISLLNMPKLVYHCWRVSPHAMLWASCHTIVAKQMFPARLNLPVWPFSPLVPHFATKIACVGCIYSKLNWRDIIGSVSGSGHPLPFCHKLRVCARHKRLTHRGQIFWSERRRDRGRPGRRLLWLLLEFPRLERGVDDSTGLAVWIRRVADHRRNSSGS